MIFIKTTERLRLTQKTKERGYETFLNAFSANIQEIICSHVHMFNLACESYIVLNSIIRSLPEAK